MSFAKQHDSGWASRKLHFAVATSVAIFVAALVASSRPTLSPLYDTMIGGLLGSLGLYLTGNMGTRWVAKRKPDDKPPEDAG